VTIDQWCKNSLEQRGMFPNQAEEVMVEFRKRAVQALGENNAYRLGDEVEGYPKQFLLLLLMDLSTCAVEWIDKNLPEAWFRPMFGGQEQPSACP
jgi:hypothetical protein